MGPQADRDASTATLNLFPEPVIRAVPAVRGYRYITLNDRVLMMDLVTNTVVHEIGR